MGYKWPYTCLTGVLILVGAHHLAKFARFGGGFKGLRVMGIPPVCVIFKGDVHRKTCQCDRKRSTISHVLFKSLAGHVTHVITIDHPKHFFPKWCFLFWMVLDKSPLEVEDKTKKFQGP